MKSKRFSEQVALVTGAASGIGLGIVGRLATEGAHVVLCDANEDLLRSEAAALTAAGLHVSIAPMDVTSEEDVSQVMRKLMEAHGRLDIVVNSAGINGPTSVRITDYNLSDFERVLAVNLTGSFLVTKYAIPHMLARNYGRILLIASIGGKEGNPGMVGYAASKSGVIGLVKAVGKEYAETGITVNGLAPAVIRTPMNEDTDPAMLRYMTDRIPMKRLGTVEEVASLACWIVSPEASFNTGFVFDLSGGRATY
ncbi:MAG: SDR family oxidoreductase [Caldilineales bacterium]|nr:SDR family oxidoreductase [Caldilineales bacterium]